MNTPLVSITIALHTIYSRICCSVFRARMKINMTGFTETQMLTITANCDK